MRVTRPAAAASTLGARQSCVSILASLSSISHHTNEEEAQHLAPGRDMNFKLQAADGNSQDTDEKDDATTDEAEENYVIYDAPLSTFQQASAYFLLLFNGAFCIGSATLIGTAIWPESFVGLVLLIISLCGFLTMVSESYRLLKLYYYGQCVLFGALSIFTAILIILKYTLTSCDYSLNNNQVAIESSNTTASSSAMNSSPLNSTSTNSSSSLSSSLPFSKIDCIPKDEMQLIDTLIMILCAATVLIALVLLAVKILIDPFKREEGSIRKLIYLRNNYVHFV